jgi:hypothetical protein
MFARKKTFARRLQIFIPEPKNFPKWDLTANLSLSMPFDLQGQAA